jgi:hypothetical protein
MNQSSVKKPLVASGSTGGRQRACHAEHCKYTTREEGRIERVKSLVVGVIPGNRVLLIIH